MKVSVIIPHLNQPEALKDCLESLAAANKAGDDVEVIVVDNGSRKVPSDTVELFPFAHFVEQPEPGPGPARNLGTSIAKGEIFAFIDADCRAKSDWIAAGLDALRDQRINIVGGDVQVPNDLPGEPYFHQPYEAIYSFRNDLHVSEGFSGAGNMMVRADVFRRVGGFLGIGQSEDREWGLRARSMGFPTTYVSDMVVYHPPRSNMIELFRKWDRHIAHDFADVQGFVSTLKWFVKAMALTVSPALEIRTVFLSKKVPRLKYKIWALVVLARIRLYRAARMFLILFSDAQLEHMRRWNS
jgi:GT2 family glycosyltransferase